jgi:TetR/AcrR family transcriptional regulator, tetracycline repressor protein
MAEAYSVRPSPGPAPALPADQFPMLIAFADTYNREPDPERYFAFGVHLLMAAVETVARARGAG